MYNSTMTLEELDMVLEKTGLDLSNPADVEAKNMVLELYGESILASRKERCERCWYRENGKCNSGCDIYGLPSDPLEAGIEYLKKPNDVEPFPFICMFVVPIYERITGKKDTMEKMVREYKRLLKLKNQRSG